MKEKIPSQPCKQVTCVKMPILLLRDVEIPVKNLMHLEHLKRFNSPQLSSTESKIYTFDSDLKDSR